MFEVNRISVIIDRSQFKEYQNGIFISEGHLPLLKTGYKLNLVDITWDIQKGDEWPFQFHLLFTGEVVDTDWEVLGKLEVIMVCPAKNEITRWGDDSFLEVCKIHLGTESEFYINNNEVDLTATINRILSSKDLVEKSRIEARINFHLDRLSKKYFGSGLLNDLLNNIFYQIGSSFEDEFGKIVISAAHDKEHFTKTKEAPPYLFLTIPSMDLEYFANHFNWPIVKIKSFELSLKSMEVLGDNNLFVHMNELTKGWDIDISLTLDLRNNIIYPVVEDIHVTGLDFLTKSLFRLFKSVLINQIEKHPISILNMYNTFKSIISRKYPFIKLQPKYAPSLDILKLNKEQTEVLLHFIYDEELA